VEQGGDELHLHALAEGELADHDVELFADVEEVDELVEGGLELVLRQAVDGAEEMERLAGGQIPPELVLLAEHEGEEAAVGVLALRGVEAERRARCRPSGR
jgi:hypothetical protein